MKFLAVLKTWAEQHAFTGNYGDYCNTTAPKEYTVVSKQVKIYSCVVNIWFITKKCGTEGAEVGTPGNVSEETLPLNKAPQGVRGAGSELPAPLRVPIPSLARPGSANPGSEAQLQRRGSDGRERAASSRQSRAKPSSPPNPPESSHLPFNAPLVPPQSCFLLPKPTRSRILSPLQTLANPGHSGTNQNCS